MLFGGDGSSSLNDTWTFDGTSWSQLSLPQSPPGRYRFAMAYDARRARVVVWGGYGTSDANVWELGPTTWEIAAVAPGPARRGDPMVAYDPVHGHLTMFGGYAVSPDNGTWSYDAAGWHQLGRYAGFAQVRELYAAPTDLFRMFVFGG